MRRRAAVVGLLVLLSGCGVNPTAGPATHTVSAPQKPGTPKVQPRGMPVGAAGRDLAFPADTLQDWVSYGDRALMIKIVSETGSGSSQLRTVRWESRAEVWANPARLRETAPRTGMATGGSSVSGAPGSDLESAGGGAALFVGHTYFAVLSHTTIGGAGPREWVPLVMLPFDDGLVGDGEQYRGWDGQQATLDAVWGLTGPQVSQLLASTPVDPATTRYASRDADVKYQLSFADR